MLLKNNSIIINQLKYLTLDVEMAKFKMISMKQDIKTQSTMTFLKYVSKKWKKLKSKKNMIT